MFKRKWMILALVIGILIIVGIGIKIAKEPTVTSNGKSLPHKTLSEAKQLLKQAKLYQQQDNLKPAIRLYKQLLSKYSQYTDVIADAQKGLEESTMKLLFSSAEDSYSTFYIVKPGDTLSKVAKEFDTTVELLQKSNNLDPSLIYSGQRLKVVNADLSILVDKTQNLLLLKANDEVVKTYMVGTGKEGCTPAGVFYIETKLKDPVWFRAGAVVPPGSPENILGSRWMGLDVEGIGIHATDDLDSIGKQESKGCIRMSEKDVKELYSIVPVGTEVKVIE